MQYHSAAIIPLSPMQAALQVQTKCIALIGSTDYSVHAVSPLLLYSESHTHAHIMGSVRF